MTKMELIERVSEKSGFSKKDAGKAIAAVFDSMSDALAEGGKVQLVGFGSFEVKQRPARKGRNPQTGEEIAVGERKVPVFKPGKNLKDMVNK
jgi:DNA-binding protein HU-beta